MKEIHDIINAYDTLDKSAIAIALALVIDVKGSSYRRTGARMLIQENGFWTGGISGGCIEGNALKKANLAIAEGKARVVTYDTENDDESQIGVTLGCNGVISVLIAPIDPKSSSNQIEQLRAINIQREPAILITVVHSHIDNLIPGEVFGYDLLLAKTDMLSGEIQVKVEGDIEAVRNSAQSKLVDYEDFTLFIEFIPPAIQLIVAGGNHDIIPLLEHSTKLGWQNIVIANPIKIQAAVNDLCSMVTTDLYDVSIDRYTVAVLMAHDYNADLGNLRKAVALDINYIGVLGPAVRRRDMLEKLLEEGVQYDKNCIFGPAGLDIGANQPEEIAIAIIAEIIASLRGRSGKSLRLRSAPINERA